MAPTISEKPATVPVIDKVYEDEAAASAGFRFDVLIIILIVLALAYVAWFFIMKYMRNKDHTEVPQDENEADLENNGEKAEEAGLEEQN